MIMYLQRFLGDLIVLFCLRIFGCHIWILITFLFHLMEQDIYQKAKNFIRCLAKWQRLVIQISIWRGLSSFHIINEDRLPQSILTLNAQMCGFLTFTKVKGLELLHSLDISIPIHTNQNMTWLQTKIGVTLFRDFVIESLS